MRGRSTGAVIALWMLASACANPPTPTEPSQTQELPAGGLNASGSGSSGTFTLQVTKNGSGSGTVTSSPSGISCGATCPSGLRIIRASTGNRIEETPRSTFTFSLTVRDQDGQQATQGTSTTVN